jgi:hypothetical protein
MNLANGVGHGDLIIMKAKFADLSPKNTVIKKFLLENFPMANILWLENPCFPLSRELTAERGKNRFPPFCHVTGTEYAPEGMPGRGEGGNVLWAS